MSAPEPVATSCNLNPQASDELLEALRDLLIAARAVRSSRAEFERRSIEIETLMVREGLAAPRGKAYVRNR